MRNMVCIAAFIVLCIIAIPVLLLTVIGKFNKRVAAFVSPYWKAFKQTWGCVGRRLTFRRCETSFKEDLKNSVLSNLVLTRPNWVKPIGIFIEVIAILIVFITLWSVVTSAKAGLSLYVYGTCDRLNPEACIIGETEQCINATTEIERNPVEQYFYEWQRLLAALPAKWQNLKEEDLVPKGANYVYYMPDHPLAIDIFDPGCHNCRNSFYNQLTYGFYEKYNTVLMPYVLHYEEDASMPLFPNSYLIASYVEAVRSVKTAQVGAMEWALMHKVLLEIVPDVVHPDGPNISVTYQDMFNGRLQLPGTPYSADKVEGILQGWLAEYGVSQEEILKITQRAHSNEVKNIIAANVKLVDEKIISSGIPITVYNGQVHTGALSKEQIEAL